LIVRRITTLLLNPMNCETCKFKFKRLVGTCNLKCEFDSFMYYASKFHEFDVIKCKINPDFNECLWQTFRHIEQTDPKLWQHIHLMIYKVVFEIVEDLKPSFHFCGINE